MMKFLGKYTFLVSASFLMASSSYAGQVPNKKPTGTLVELKTYKTDLVAKTIRLCLSQFNKSFNRLKKSNKFKSSNLKKRIDDSSNSISKVYFEKDSGKEDFLYKKESKPDANRSVYTIITDYGQYKCSLKKNADAKFKINLSDLRKASDGIKNDKRFAYNKLISCSKKKTSFLSWDKEIKDYIQSLQYSHELELEINNQKQTDDLIPKAYTHKFIKNCKPRKSKNSAGFEAVKSNFHQVLDNLTNSQNTNIEKRLKAEVTEKQLFNVNHGDEDIDVEALEESGTLE